MSRQDIENVMTRYLKGTASDEEKRQVENWLDKSETENKDWQALGEQERIEWLNTLYGDIRTQLDTGAKVVQLKSQAKLWQKMVAAAAILLVFFSAYLTWNYLSSKEHRQQMAIIKTDERDKRQITLPDSSKIWVNAESELKYDPAFTGKVREVYLRGEAYFDIAHDATRPFLIHTAGVVTTVLGTAFNIKEDTKTHKVIVTVTRGKVSVSRNNKVLGILTPDQQLTYDLQNQQLQQVSVNTAQVIAWQQADMHFDDISFSEAANMLEKRFKTSINFKNDRVKRCRFTGTSLAGKNLEQILKVVCEFNNATYQKNADGTITIDGPGCGQ